MKNLGLIPVRGGSKRLPNKNLLKINGKSITHRAIDAALESKCFDELIVSTDCSKIIEHCKQYEIENKIIIDKRKKNLAQDTSTVIQVTTELMKRINQENKKFETITVMLATCPFKKAQHIQKGFELLSPTVDSVISVTEYNFPWEMSLFVDNELNATTTFQPSVLQEGKTRSQDREKVYHPNGAFYIGKWESTLRDFNFYKGTIKAYPMSKNDSLDIDTKEDLDIARALCKLGYIS